MDFKYCIKLLGKKAMYFAMDFPTRADFLAARNKRDWQRELALRAAYRAGIKPDTWLINGRSKSGKLEIQDAALVLAPRLKPGQMWQEFLSYLSQHYDVTE